MGDAEAISTLLAQCVLAPVVVNVIETLKRWPSFFLMRTDTRWTNWLASLASALVLVTGITFATSGSLQAGGSLCVYVPPARQVVEFLLRFFFQHYAQKSYYHLVSLRKATPA